MKKFISIVGLLVAASATGALNAETTKRPNFVIIIADDHGIGDVSAYRDVDVKTPNIDRIGSDGILFKNMRANCTVCSPSRAALLTGKYPDRVGVPGVIRTKPEDSWGYLDPSVPTLADELKKFGYRTAIVGKWHLGLEDRTHPNVRGFEIFRGFLGDMMDSYYTHRREGFNYMREDSSVVDPPPIHATDLFANWAVELIAQRGGRLPEPFFLYLAFNAPHFPIEPPDEWLEKVRKRLPTLDENRMKNVAMVEHLDSAVGKVLDALTNAGLDENTLIVYTSDNGGSLPHAQNNDPWRDGKQSHYDGGLRIPFLMRWKGTIAPNSMSDYAGLNFDLYPTFLEIARGAPFDEVEERIDFDGVSLVPIIQGGSIKAPRDLYFVRREGGSAYGGKSYEAIIRGDWKLLQNDPYSPLELYNLREDPFEKNNLAKANRAKVNELAAAMRKHIQRGGSVPWQPPSEK